MAEENNQLNNNQNNNHVEVQEKQPKNIWKILTIVLVILLIIVYIRPFSGGISEGEAKTKALTYINSILQGRAVADIKSIESKGDLYKMTIDINGEEMPTYMTKDGSLLFPTALDLTTPIQSVTGSTTQEIPKTKTPKVELFVMSFCPYGNLGEDTLFQVYDLLKDKVDWNINYIVSVSGNQISSLHGQTEVDQNIREVCIKKDYGLETFWKFINYINKNCGRDGSCWEDAAKEAKVDTTKVQTCLKDEGLNLMKIEAEKSSKAGANGSPTLLINGIKTDVVYKYGNSEAYKQAVCNAFEEAPKECEEVLSTQSNQATGSC